MKTYLISPPRIINSFKESFFEKLTTILDIQFFQIRQKHSDSKEDKVFAKNCYEKFNKICKKKKIKLILNNDIKLAKEIGYDGVHIGQNDISCRTAREFLGNKLIIGVSCNNSIEQAKIAKNNGADYVAFGPAFNSKTKITSRNILDLNLIKKKKNQIQLPFTLIGGINHYNIKYLKNIGASNLAFIDSIWNFESGPVESAKLFMSIWEKV